MNVSVFGLGYVGSVSAAAFAEDGHTVVGVDVNADKVAMLNAGQSPIVEPGLGPLVASNVAAGRLRATTDVFEAVAASDVSLISVSTPKPPQRQSRSHVSHAGLRADRRGVTTDIDVSRRRCPQHRAARDHA